MLMKPSTRLEIPSWFQYLVQVYSYIIVQNICDKVYSFVDTI